MNMNRRNLLRATALALPAIALAGCVASTANGVTTITLNLATLDAYATAVENGATTLLGISLISAALGSPKVVLIKALIAGVVASIAALDAANHGGTSLSFTTASIPAALTALQTDASTIFADIETVATSLGGSLASNVVTTVEALQTIVSLLVALTSTAVGAVKTPMTGSQALQVLGA